MGSGAVLVTLQTQRRKGKLMEKLWLRGLQINKVGVNSYFQL